MVCSHTVNSRSAQTSTLHFVIALWYNNVDGVLTHSMRVIIFKHKKNEHKESLEMETITLAVNNKEETLTLLGKLKDKNASDEDRMKTLCLLLRQLGLNQTRLAAEEAALYSWLYNVHTQYCSSYDKASKLEDTSQKVS